MPLYRGDGGSGDASTDAYASQLAENTQTTITKAKEAADSAAAALSSENNASTSEDNALDYKNDAQKLAINAEDSQYTLSDGVTTGYSALHHKEKAIDAQTAAETAESNAQGHETAASGYATTASGHATTATTQAGIATNQASTATAQAGIATTKASEASDDADDAEKLAINPEDSQFTLSDGVTTGYSALHYNEKAQDAKTAAETARTAAETAQAAAEAAQEAIDGFFLGAQASNPTVDLNGNAVTAGDWYFNTGDNTTRIYDGSGWQTVNPDLIGDTTPQLGGTLDANGNNIDMGVNVITDVKVGQWDTAYGWGNHASAGYLTSFTETNDLTAAVTWANVPDANITQASVTQHQAALSITESQISDLQSYLTGNETITLTGAITGSGTTSIATTLSSIDGGTY